jgi:hypothetical protein
MKNQLEKAKQIYKDNDHADWDIDDTFRWCCGDGHLDMVQWLLSLKDIDLRMEEDYCFYWSCMNGHLPLAAWLAGSLKEDIYKYTINDGEIIEWSIKYDGIWVRTDPRAIAEQSHPTVSTIP